MNFPNILSFLLSFIALSLTYSAASANYLRKENPRQISRSLDTMVTLECVVSEIDGFFPPDDGHREETIYGCTSDDDSTFFFNEDPLSLFGESFISGETILSVSLDAFTSDGLIDVEKASIPGASSVTLMDDSSARRRLTKTGMKTVLVIRVQSSDGSIAPSQSEAKMANDVFEDENNLARRFDECSSGKLQFGPASGNGVITVKTDIDLTNTTWRECGNIAMGGAESIDRDHTLIVCPDEVDFGGAAAWGTVPGIKSWYRSKYASVPKVQMHELGHNLGHSHSGKGGSTYADPTCNMGNKGSWSDIGSRFCFNAAKTFVNGWYSEYDHTMDPSKERFDGKLYGINAVRDGTIPNDGKVTLKLQGENGEFPLYLIFQRKAGANIDIPDYGDTVVITEQEKERGSKSSWKAALRRGDSYSFQWGSGISEIKVCQIDLNKSSADVVIGKSGEVFCDFLDDELPLCQDAPGKFNWGNYKQKTCKFVASKATKRCKRPQAAEACPATCAEHVHSPCQPYDRSSSFNLQKVKRTCDEAVSLGFCSMNKVRSFCPISCGVF